MGTMPALSILKGSFEILRNKDEPIFLHEIFQHTIESIENLNNNNDKIPGIHGITLREGEPCLILGEHKLPLNIVNEQANQIARAIQRGFQAKYNQDGDTVIVVDLPPSLQLIVTLLAIWKLGAAYLPLDATFPDHRVQHILNESKPALIIAEQADKSSRYHGFPTINYETLVEDANLLSTDNLASMVPWAKRVRAEDQIGIILYTSGSTGVPKGVRLSHRAVLNRLKWQWKTLPYSSTENVCVFKTALTFVDSVAEIWGPLMWGRSLLILKKQQVIDIEVFVEALEKYKIERLVVVPSLLRSMLLYLGMLSNEKTPFRPSENMKKNKYLSSLKYCISSGEPLPPQLALKFYQFFSPENHTILNLYGSTEVMGDILYHAVRPEETSTTDRIPIGRPLDNTNVYILDKHFRPVNNGDVGELYASGHNLATGYVNGRDPDKFIENPIAVDPAHAKMYRTGDYARLIKGAIYYEGRTDSQIKVRGHKVDLSEVDAAMTKVQSVNKSVVLCYKAGSIDQALLTFATVKCPEVTSSRVEEHLQQLLPPYMVPKVVVVPNIPLLVNGKVDRQFLLKQYEEDAKEDRCQAFNFDYTDIPSQYEQRAKVLFETVASTLKHSMKNKITSASNYFHLGGNSLNAVLAVTTLRDLGYVISVGEFISANTMMDVILRMHEEETSNDISLGDINQISPSKYQVELLNDQLKEDTIRIITESFCEKAELESFISPRKEDYRELVNAVWETLIDQKLSFAVKTLEGKVLSVCLNMDLHAEPEITINSELVIIFEFLEFLEAPFRDNVLPKGTGQVMHSFMMGTGAEVSTQQNIELILFMEHENMKLATSRGYAGIFTTNTSPLTQQLGTDVLQFKVLLDYQINKYTAADGSRPFAAADNSYRSVVSWKPIE